MAQTNWQNLPSTSTPLNASNLNKIENFVKYSTSEIECGTWIDNTPIYRKVISYTPTETIGELNTITDIRIPINISNFKYAIKIDGVMFDNNGNTTMIPNMSGNNVSGGIVVNGIIDNNIRLRIINDTWASSRTFYFIIEYTKTTD